MIRSALTFSPGWAELQRVSVRRERWQAAQTWLFVLAAAAVAVAELVSP